MKKIKKTLHIESSPHIHAGGGNVETIMRNVVYALIPTALFAVVAFGLSALLVIVVAILSCVITERVLCFLSKQNNTVNDWSIIITGLIYGLTLPPGLALWMVFVGAVFAVAIGKFIFGGLGYNPFNPALVGRAFLQAAFPSSMTNWSPAFSDDRFTSLPSSILTLPLASPVYDQLSSATPLAAHKFDNIDTAPMDLLLGLSSGSTGETCAILILAGGLYLIARNMMNWRIPVGILLTVFVLSSLFHGLEPDKYPGAWFMLFSGGLMLGAMFMATDPVASPITHLGCLLYGILIGLLIVLIRLWGGLPEGVMYAILFANAVSPHIDRWIQPTAFGTGNSP